MSAGVVKLANNIVRFGKDNLLDESITTSKFIVMAVFMLLWSALHLYGSWYISLGAALLFVTTVIFLVKPEAGAFVLVFLVPTFSNNLGFYFNQTNIGLRTNKTLPLYALFLILGVLALGVKKASALYDTEQNPAPFKKINTVLMLYAAMSVMFWTPVYEYGLVSFILMFFNVSLFYFIFSAVRTEEIHKRIMVCWVLAGVITAVLVLLSIYDIPKEFLYHSKLGEWITFIFNNSTKVKIRGHAFGHPNAASTILNMVACVNVGLLVFEESKLRQRLLWASLIIIVFANLLTMSKAGIGSFLAMVFFFLFMFARLRKHIIRNIVIGTLIVTSLFILSIVYAGEKRTPRLMHVSYRGEVISLKDRFDMWKEGLAQMKRRKLVVVGLGPGGFDYTTNRPHSHNLFLSFFFDYGLAGIGYALILFFAFGKKVYSITRNNFREQKSYLKIMSVSFCGGIIALGIHSTVDQYYLKSVIWLFLGLAATTFSLDQTEQMKEKTDR